MRKDIESVHALSIATKKIISEISTNDLAKMTNGILAHELGKQILKGIDELPATITKHHRVSSTETILSINLISNEALNKIRYWGNAFWDMNPNAFNSEDKKLIREIYNLLKANNFLQ